MNIKKHSLIPEHSILISKNNFVFCCSQHKRHCISFYHEHNKNICDLCEYNKDNIEKNNLIKDNFLNDFKNNIKKSEDNF